MSFGHPERRWTMAAHAGSLEKLLRRDGRSSTRAAWSPQGESALRGSRSNPALNVGFDGAK